MAVFDEAPECLHPLPQYLGGHGYRFVTVHNFARQELAAAKNQDPTIDWKIVYSSTSRYIHVYYKPRTRICRAEELPPAV